MADQDIFAENETTQTQETTSPSAPVNPFEDKLKEIRNADGNPKYDSVEKALEALKASQEFIDVLKNEKHQTAKELEEAKAQLAKMGSIDDFVNRISNTQTTKAPEATPQLEGLSEEKVQSLVQKALQERESKSQQEKNLATVIGKLSEAFGEEADKHVAQRAKELNTTPAKLKQLAMESPELALAALVVGGKRDSNASPRPTISSTTSTKDTIERPKFEKGITQGGLSNRELAARWNEVGEFTRKRLGVASQSN